LLLALQLRLRDSPSSTAEGKEHLGLLQNQVSKSRIRRTRCEMGDSIGVVIMVRHVEE
jgi:hypothetical protein